MQKNKRARWAVGMALAVALLVVLAAVWRWTRPAVQSGHGVPAALPTPPAGSTTTADDDPSRAVPAALWNLAFPDLTGKQQTLAQWKGKVLVVNFWATWCPPCRAEIPNFIREQAQYQKQGLQFVGIAVDNPDAVKTFARQFGINYPVLRAGTDGMELAQALGDTSDVLPYTLIIDRKGNAVATAAGMLDPDRFVPVIRPLLGR